MQLHRKIDLDKLAAAHPHGHAPIIVIAPHEQFEWKTASRGAILFHPHGAEHTLDPNCLEAHDGMHARANPHATAGQSAPYRVKFPGHEHPVEVQVIIGSGIHGYCDDFTARHNQYFIWHNESNDKVHIDCADHRHKPHFWHTHGYHLHALESVAVMVPREEPVGFYELKVVTPHGNACLHCQTNPMISIPRS